MNKFSMYSYSWDIAENGVSETLAEYKKMGVNTVTLAGSYHAGKFFRPKSKKNKIYFPEDGTVYFKHNPSNYGQIKPIPHSIFGNGSIFEELIRSKNIDVNAWLVLLHNSNLGMQHPDSVVRNAFGDPYIYALCPSVPEARAYAIGLCKDVTERYALDGISIESIGFPPFEHGYHHEMSFVRPNYWLSQNLGLCFCKHCISGAKKNGIDAEGLKSRVAKKIHDYLESDLDYTSDMAQAFWLADVEGDRDLRKYLSFRKNVVTSLAEEIRNSVRREVEVAIIPSVARPTSGAWYEGSDLKELAQATGAIEACFYEPSIERIAADLHDIKGRIDGAGKIKGILRPAFPDLTSEQAVIDAVSALWNGGVKDIAFYNYGHIRTQSLGWVEKALKKVSN